MGCLQSTTFDDEAKARNDEIENQLTMDSLTAKNEIKILMITAGDPTKGKLIHHGGYNESEREAYRKIIFSNTVQSMRAILEVLPMLELHLAPKNEPNRETIFLLPSCIEGDVLPPNIANAVRYLWRDPAVREAVRRSSEFQLNESATYYFNSVERMASAPYLPNDQDILRSRVKTTGITETAFKVGELTHKVFDMSGNRGERRKWIPCFENVTAVLFVASMNDYDQMLDEDNSMTHMQEALGLFDSICNSPWFPKTSIMLFLADIDLFAEKLPHSPLENYFPDYTGGSNYDAACDYLLHRFVSLNQNSRTKQIYAHYTTLRDTQQMKFVLSAIQDILLQLHLREKGLLPPPRGGH
ncbi:hypothetical protein GALMADRAFT_209454 [Galerina marginata CBS 339.88]|uniref:Uncharacterized protein n=1 Tax=Galerina marginata (strain CBS 339.88) TaxID=685588 RepID=A0A067T4F1_GALM3|nr:hypothetical protein GALMADRAFT_209454 [Galerina marginata CBS 339.88]